MKVAYYPGCSLHSTAREYDISSQLVLRKLGVELEEIPDWICCGASAAHTTSHLLSVSLPCKNLVLAQEMGVDTVISPCAACFNRLTVANQEVAEGTELRKEVSQVLGKSYSGEMKVRHPLQLVIEDVGIDEISKMIVRRLEGLKVVSYYGCLLVRPTGMMNLDDVEDPQYMDNLVTALGGEALPWPFKTECCGASFSLSQTDIVIELSGDIVNEAHQVGAECILVACPLCQSNLDLRQKAIGKRFGRKFNLPVIYFTQLLGIALGIDMRELGLSKHVVDPRKLLKKKLKI